MNPRRWALNPTLAELYPKASKLPIDPSKVGEHVGLLLAPIKAKERAMDKAAADYAKNPEKPAARYVFLGYIIMTSRIVIISIHTIILMLFRPNPKILPNKSCTTRFSDICWWRVGAQRCDFLRATVFASDPFVLAVAFDQLRKRFEVVRVKNKFREAELNPELRTNILVNLWVRRELT